MQSNVEEALPLLQGGRQPPHSVFGRAASKAVQQLRRHAEVRLLQTVQCVFQRDQLLTSSKPYYSECPRHSESPFSGGPTTLPFIEQHPIGPDGQRRRDCLSLTR